MDCQSFHLNRNIACYDTKIKKKSHDYKTEISTQLLNRFHCIWHFRCVLPNRTRFPHTIAYWNKHSICKKIYIYLRIDVNKPHANCDNVVKLTIFVFITKRHQTGDDTCSMSRDPNPQLLYIRLAKVHQLLNADELFEAFCKQSGGEKRPLDRI